MPLGLPLYWALLKKVIHSWLADYAPSMGAALAFYTLSSLAPLLLIAISVVGLIFGQDAARGEIESQLRALIGESGALPNERLDCPDPRLATVFWNDSCHWLFADGVAGWCLQAPPTALPVSFWWPPCLC